MGAIASRFKFGSGSARKQIVSRTDPTMAITVSYPSQGESSACSAEIGKLKLRVREVSDSVVNLWWWVARGCAGTDAWTRKTLALGS